MIPLRQKFFIALVCLILSSVSYIFISNTTPETHRLSIKINLNYDSDTFRDVLYNPEFLKWWIEQNYDLPQIINISTNQNQDAIVEASRSAMKDRFFWVRTDTHTGLLYIEHSSEVLVDFIYPRVIQKIEDYYQFKKLQTVTTPQEISESLIKNSVISEDKLRPTQTQKIYLFVFIFLSMLFASGIYVTIKNIRNELTAKKLFLIRFAPLIAILLYLGLTMAIFFSRIIEWPRRYSAPLLLAFLICCIFAITAGYIYGTKKQKKALNFYDQNIPTFLWVLILLSTLANFISPYIYTGSTPADFFKLLSDQHLAYMQMLAHLKNLTFAERLPIIVTKAVSSPGVVSVLSLLIIFSKQLKPKHICLCLLWIVSLIYFSVFRATDKEMGDIAIFTTAALLIKLFHTIQKHDIQTASIIKLFASIVLAGVLFLSIFTYRKNERTGHSTALFCATDVVCASATNPLYQNMGKNSYHALGLFANYVSQGYYGLGLALEYPYEPSLGIGLFPVLTPYADQVYPNFFERTYPAKLKHLGWSALATWSTALTWIASDVSFIGVPLLLLLISILFGKAWLAAIYDNRLSACVLFSLIFYFFIYMPANNQLFQSIDYLLGAFVFTALFFYENSSKKDEG